MKTLKPKGMIRKSYLGDGKKGLMDEKGYQKPTTSLKNDELSADEAYAQGSGEYSLKEMKGVRNHRSLKRVMGKKGY
jgi:hypothetical protein